MSIALPGIAVWTTAVVAVAAFVVFLHALRKRWLAGYVHGFLITLGMAVGGTALVMSALLGLWGHDASRTLLFEETVEELASMSRVIEAEIHESVRFTVERLGNLAEALTADVARGDRDRVSETIRAVQSFNPRFLQINVVDAEGMLLVSSSRGEALEPVNRVGTMLTLEGKSFASDAYLSEIFKTYVLYLSAPMRQDVRVVGAVTLRYDLQDSLARVVVSTRFQATSRMTLTNSDGHVLAHRDVLRIGTDISAQPAVQRAREGKTGWVIGDAEGHPGLFVYRPIPSPSTIEAKPWMLIVEQDTAEALAGMRKLAVGFTTAAAVVLVICLLVAWQISRALDRPIDDMLAMVHRVGAGELAARSGLSGRDEIGRMGEALDSMARGLEERERIRDVLGRYMTTQVSEEILKGQITLGGASRRVTILFSDVRNFTTMAEGMTPAEVVTFLNGYFSEMVDAVFEQGGVLDKFIGDGILAIFGSIEEGADHPRRAVLAAQRMTVRLAKLNGERSVAGQPPIVIGIGIHTDEVIVGNIGSHRRLEYTVVGDGVNTCARVEAANKEFGTTILITQSTYDSVRGEFECRAMPAAALKGKVQNLPLYEVLSASRAPLAGLAAGRG